MRLTLSEKSNSYFTKLIITMYIQDTIKQTPDRCKMPQYGTSKSCSCIRNKTKLKLGMYNKNTKRGSTTIQPN